MQVPTVDQLNGAPVGKIQDPGRIQFFLFGEIEHAPTRQPLIVPVLAGKQGIVGPPVVGKIAEQHYVGRNHHRKNSKDNLLHCYLFLLCSLAKSDNITNAASISGS